MHASSDAPLYRTPDQRRHATVANLGRLRALYVKQQQPQALIADVDAALAELLADQQPDAATPDAPGATL